MKYRSSAPTSERLEQRMLLDASAEFVAEFNTTPSAESEQHAWLADEMFFVADDGIGDVELWKTDGTQSGTLRVRDLAPGRQSSFPTSLVATDSRVFFTARDTDHGRELWATDGTEAGTLRVTDLEAGPEHSFHRDETFHSAGDLLFFTRHGEPWVSDGTPEGTRLLKDIRPGDESSTPVFGDALGGQFYFTADTSDSNRKLWESDGTEDGTKFVADASHILQTFNDQIVYFHSSTSELRSFDPVSNQSTTLDTLQAAEVFDFASVVVGNQLYFAASNKLWRLDGEAVVPIETSNRSIIGLYPFGNDLMFTDWLPHTQRLWRVGNNDTEAELIRSLPRGAGAWSDGESFYATDTTTSFGLELGRLDGNRLVPIDVAPGVQSSNPRGISVRDGTAYFWTGNSPAMWKTDGTQEGTERLKTIRGASEGWDEQDPLHRPLVAVSNGIVVDGTNGLYFIDETKIQRIAADTDFGNVLGLTSFREKAFFVTVDEFADELVWVTDGSTEGTKLFRSSEGEPFYSYHNGREQFTELDDLLYFTACADECGLWRTDGTTEGTVLVSESESIFEIAKLNDQEYFLDVAAGILYSNVGAGEDAVVFEFETELVNPYLLSAGNQIFVFSHGSKDLPARILATDGTSVGTELISEVADGIPSFQSAPIVLGESVVFQTSSSVWGSDGTTAGTREIADLAKLQAGEGLRGGNFLLERVGDRVFFATNQELWSTDGTEAGTQFVADVAPYRDHWAMAAEEINGELYFAGCVADICELWRSDGTESGTVQLTNFAVTETESAPKYLTEFNGHVYFTVNDGFHGRELYRLPLEDLTPLPGDADGNGAVDFADFLVLSQNFGRADDVAFADGDFDADGEIDFSDFLLLSSNFGRRLKQ